LVRVKFFERVFDKSLFIVYLKKLLKGHLILLEQKIDLFFYNKDKLIRSSRSLDGHQLNFFISPHLGGLGMYMEGMTFITAKRYKEISKSNLATMEPFCILTKVQSKIANRFYHSWTKPYIKKPMKPIGEELSTDVEKNHFRNLKHSILNICYPEKVPIPPWCRMKKGFVLPHNCQPSNMSSHLIEDLRMKNFGVRLMKKDVEFCYDTKALSLVFKEYEYKYDLNSVQLEQERFNRKDNIIFM